MTTEEVPTATIGNPPSSASAGAAGIRHGPDESLFIPLARYRHDLGHQQFNHFSSATSYRTWRRQQRDHSDRRSATPACQDEQNWPAAVEANAIACAEPAATTSQPGAVDRAIASDMTITAGVAMASWRPCPRRIR